MGNGALGIEKMGVGGEDVENGEKTEVWIEDMDVEKVENINDMNEDEKKSDNEDVGRDLY